MDGVIGMDEARALVGNAALWPRVREFLWDFARQVHPSWLADLENLEALAHFEQRTNLLHLDSPRIKRFVLESLEVVPCFHAFPKDDGSRLLLLDAATLEDIARWLGALACAGELRRITGGAAVRELKAALPGVYPEVFGYVAYFSGLDSRRGDAEVPRLEDKIVQTGCELLSVALSALPVALVSRLKFKFAKDSAIASLVPSGAEEGCETLDARREKVRSQIFKLLKLKFPEAYSLCCS
jgi:hypothetical protein